MRDDLSLRRSRAVATGTSHSFFCQDEVGDRLYRFLYGRAGFDVWAAGSGPPVWAQKVIKVAPYLEPRPASQSSPLNKAVALGARTTDRAARRQRIGFVLSSSNWTAVAALAAVGAAICTITTFIVTSLQLRQLRRDGGP